MVGPSSTMKSKKIQIAGLSLKITEPDKNHQNYQKFMTERTKTLVNNYNVFFCQQYL